MRREVSAAKTAAYKKFLDEMGALPAASAIQKTSKMAKALVRREKQNRSSGSPIEPEVFSAHIANICSSEEVWNGDMRRFVPHWSFRDDIESAILASPNGKAPGLDGVRNEMTKADIKLTSKLVFGKRVEGLDLPRHSGTRQV